MNSSTSRTAEHKRRQEELKRQIEELEGKLLSMVEDEDEDEVERVSLMKRKMSNDRERERERDNKGVMLAPDTPSPKKKRKLEYNHGPKQSSNLPLKYPSKSSASGSGSASRPVSSSAPTFTKPKPSSLLSRLTSITKANKRNAQMEGDRGNDDDGGEEEEDTVERSTGFEEKVKVVPTSTSRLRRLVATNEDRTDVNDEGTDGPGPRRDSTLALIEDLQPGPYEFPRSTMDETDDPEFEKLEPHSGIHLKSRTLPHSTLNSYLLGRFYLSPSKLYSIIRISSSSSDKGGKGGEGYDIPVPGDWVTIAVVAERGPIKFTRAPIGVGRDEEDGDGEGRGKWKGKQKEGSADSGGGGGGGKKYVTLKLIDFGARSGVGASGSIRGDAFLNLILFEADGFDVIERDDGRRKEKQKVYRGGSGGAFERMMDVREGDVVALLNPRVLRPFQQRTSDNQNSPHPQTNILALSPTSASSIVILGRARDLGMCTVRKKDGKICGGWCDLRANKGGGYGSSQQSVCEYHVLNAVKDRRAGRAEFAVGTSSMSTSAKYAHKYAYDPAKKWGLQPSGSNKSSNGSSSAMTYVFSGHVITNNSTDSRSVFISETIGREGQARAKRVMDAKEEERKVLKALKVAQGGGALAIEDRKGKMLLEQESEDGRTQKKTYSAEFIKALGFDPAGRKGGEDSMKKSQGVKDKLDALEALSARKNSKKKVELGPRPGKRVRSGVVAPDSVELKSSTGSDRDEELEFGFGHEMIDLDDL